MGIFSVLLTFLRGFPLDRTAHALRAKNGRHRTRYRPKSLRSPDGSRCARDIRFNHPVTGVELFVEASLPHDFQLLLKQLARHAAAPPSER